MGHAGHLPNQGILPKLFAHRLEGVVRFAFASILRQQSHGTVRAVPKVSLLDTDHIWGVGGNHAWVWRSFLRGHNPIFMDPYDGAILGDTNTARMVSPQFELLRLNMGYTLRYAAKMNLAAMTPHGELASTEFCLANPAKEYLAYLPDGGRVTMDLSAASGLLAVAWFNPRSGDATPGESTSGGGKRSFEPPFDGDAVLYISKQSP
jgi:hypothetical protein